MSIKRASTRGGSLTAAAALAASLFATAANAATMEEILVHGTTAGLAARRAEFEAQMASFVRDVEIELKRSVRRGLEQSATPQIELAQSTDSHRG